MSAEDRGVCPRCGEVICGDECQEARFNALRQRTPTPDSERTVVDGIPPANAAENIIRSYGESYACQLIKELELRL